MTVFLERVDSVPVVNVDLPMPLLQWMAVLVDSLNEALAEIQDNINLNTAQSYTAAEIAALTNLPDGVILYDTTNNEYVGKVSGSLVKFTVTPYP